VNVTEFLDTADRADPRSVYLFCPDKAGRSRQLNYEPVLAQRAVDALVDRMVDPSMRDMVYSAYYADETPVGEVIAMAETLPFLADRRVVVVSNAEHYESESKGKSLHLYLEAPCESTTLILLANRIDRRLKLFKLCNKLGAVIVSPALQQREAAVWTRKEIEDRGKKADTRAVNYLVERTGTHLGDVLNAVHNVCDYVGDETAITEADITAACADVAEEEIWAMTDAIAASDTGAALRALRELIALGKNEFEVMGSINWLLKSAWAAGPGQGKIAPFVAKKMRPLADKLGEKRLAAAFGALMKTEIMLRSTGVDRSLAIELLVVKLAASGRRPTPRQAG
jgi:DNA polymerase-3 subunit delta